MTRYIITLILIIISFSTEYYASPIKLSGLELLQPKVTVQSALVPYTLSLKHISPESAKEHLQALFPDIKITQSGNAHRVVVMCPERDIKSIQKVIDSLDIPSKQLLFDVQIIEISNDYRNQYAGLLFNSTNGFAINYDFSTNQLNALSDLNAILSAMVSSGNARILAKPHVTTLETKAAQIKVGDRIPYTNTVFQNNSSTVQVHFIDTGIQLDIKARITSGNRIVADIDSEISSVRAWREFDDVQFPVIASRKTRSTVQLKHQETLVIAGLLDDSTHNSSSHIPFLGKLPILGNLFRTRYKETVQTDIVFMITPRISSEK
jgi:type II secretory pathway component GspD/PulD (secretin)